MMQANTVIPPNNSRRPPLLEVFFRVPLPKLFAEPFLDFVRKLFLEEKDKPFTGVRTVFVTRLCPIFVFKYFPPKVKLSPLFERFIRTPGRIFLLLLNLIPIIRPPEYMSIHCSSSIMSYVFVFSINIARFFYCSIHPF
jgi:hypothetical protein